MSSSAVLLLAPFPGKTISVPYLGYEKVDLVVQRALSKMVADGIGVNSQTVRTYFNGIAINDWSRTIDNCKIYGSVITLDFELLPGAEKTGAFPIQIKTLTGKVYTLMVSSSLRLYEVMRMIQHRDGTSPNLQRLIYQGRQLEAHETLDSLNICKDAILHLVLRLRGGGALPVDFVDMETATTQKLVFTDNAPLGRIACKGLNVEVKCPCTPTHLVICQQHFGLYELGQGGAMQCPVCFKNQADPVTVAFNTCEYRAHGLKDDGSHFSTDWIKVDDGRYTRYDPAKQTKWKRLAIETRPLHSYFHQELCVICLLFLRDDGGHKLETLACKHQFHKACIDSWHGSCPICRASRL